MITSESAMLPVADATFLEQIKTWFNVSREKNALSDWQSGVISAIWYFLSQVKEQVIKGHGLRLSSLMVSYVPESAEGTPLENAMHILNQCLSDIGIALTFRVLTNGVDLKTHLQQHDILLVLCTPAYAQKIAQEPVMREMIDAFGKSKNDSLHTLLCAGGFGETALKVVDSHYLIRSYQGALKREASLIALQTFVDVMLSVSGSQGLGVVPDMLDLEKRERAKAYSRYKKLFNALSKTVQDLTSHYRLSQHLEREIAHHPLKEHAVPRAFLNLSLSKILDGGVVKTGLFLCPSKADTLLTGLELERGLLGQGRLVLSVDCHDYTAKSAPDAVRFALTKLQFKRPEIEALKQSEIVIIFKNYEQLGAYDNLYVKNQLRHWPKTKVVVTCHAEHFQHRDYQSCFLSDPANPQMDSLSVQLVPHFATPAAEEVCVLNVRNSPLTHTFEQDTVLHPKSQATQSEVMYFLEGLHATLVEANILKPVLSENPQAFISYAWEADKVALARQQRHLSRIAGDLGALGIPTWLDIERMTGDIDEQMAGNIKDSHYALVVGTARYTQRAAQPTNVKKEYQAILAKESAGALKVFPLQFSDETPFPSELMGHPRSLDFRGIDDEAVYIQQLTKLIPQLVAVDPVRYQEHLDALGNALKMLPARHLITDKNQDEMQSYDIDNRLKAYVKPHALLRAEDGLDTRFDLPEHFSEHLAKDTKTYVTLGRSGSGKSLFTLFTFKRLLQEWHQWRAGAQGSRPEWLPIYIPLRNYAYGKAEQAIALALQVYQLDAEDIQHLKKGLGVNQKILFILDGYDELGKGIRPNYAEQLRDWPYAKLLISGRPEHFDSDVQHKEAFSLNQEYRSFQLIYVSPFSPEEIKEYVAAYDPHPDTYAKVESIPGLMPLLDNPFLLNLVLQALPRLLETHPTGKQAIQRSDIYQAFVDTLFNKEAYKQQEIQEGVMEVLRYHQFAEALAFSLFAEKSLSVTSDKSRLWQQFTAVETHIREACPLKRTGGEYTYIHKSAYEYFVAVRLWNALNEAPEVLTTLWNVRSLTTERAVIDFLVEFYQTNRLFHGPRTGEKPVYVQARERLFQLVEASKEDASVAQSASNAMTVLNNAHVPLWSKDFSKVRIPGADLRGAICDNVHFEEADLTDVQFQAAALSDVHFQGANMSGVALGQWPSLYVSGTVRSFCYANKGALLAVAVGSVIEIYHTSSMTLLQKLVGHSGSVNSVSFSHDDTRLVSGSEDTTVRVWDVTQGVLQKTFEGHTGVVNTVSFSPNDVLVVSGGKDPVVRVWDVESGALQRTLAAPGSSVESVSFSPNGELLAFGSNEWADAAVRLWNVKTGKLRATLEGHTGRICSLAFSPNGKLLASGSSDATVRLWDVERGLCQKTLEGHTQRVNSVSLSAEGERLASGSADGSIRLWNVECGECEQTFQDLHSASINRISLHPNGQLLASVTEWSKSIEFWEVECGPAQKPIEGHTARITSVLSSPNSALVVSGSHDGTIRLWDSEHGRLQKTLEGRSGLVHSLSFSPTGQYLASGNDDKTIQLWDLEQGVLYKTLEDQTQSVFSVAFSPDGEKLASAGYDLGEGNNTTVRLWNVKQGELVKSFTGDSERISSIAFSPNGALLACGCLDKNVVQLWDVQSGELLKTLEGHEASVNSVSFCYNGSQLASGDSDGGVRFWQVPEGRLQKTVEMGKCSIMSVSFSPNRPWLASWSWDSPIQLWNEEGQFTEIDTFSDISSVCWSHTPRSIGTFLATAHRDQSVRYWSVTEREGSFYLELLWSSKKSTTLIPRGMNIQGVQGLSLLNVRFLEQWGVQGKPRMRESLTLAAEQGDASAQAALGKLYEAGEEVPQDFSVAVYWLAQAVEQKHPEAAFHLGRCYQKGQGAPQDLSRAIQLFMLGAERGGVAAQTALGHCYRAGAGSAVDTALALQWFHKAAESDDAEAQFMLGECYRLGEGVGQSYKEAFQWYSRAAAQNHASAMQALDTIPGDWSESKRETYYLAKHGDLEAQNELGCCYFQGDGGSPDIDQAIAWWTEAAQKGNPQAQHHLAECYQTGQGVGQDAAAAVRWWTRASALGYPEAQFHLAECHEQGLAVTRDLTQAVALYTQASEQGHAKAQLRLGYHYQQGLGVAQNDHRAAELWTHAAQQQNAEAQFRLAECYRVGHGVEQSYRSAFQFYASAAEQGYSLAVEALQEVPADFSASKREAWYAAEHGDSEAQNELALAYYEGSWEVVTQDVGKALAWWTRAAEQGNAKAQNYLGECYQKGEGIFQSVELAIQWWTRAADQGNPEAQFNMGQCYEQGIGVRQDIIRAVALYTQAAEQGHMKAQASLGGCYKEGQGVVQDYQKAVELLTKAAEQSHAVAQINLGMCYQYGYGVRQNLKQAVEWFSKAAVDMDWLPEALRAEYRPHRERAQFLLKQLHVPEGSVEATQWYAAQGDLDAYVDLAKCYLEGQGVPQDFSLARVWFTQAAEQGSAEAQYWLGVFCEEGLGCAQDSEQAFQWFNKVIASEDPCKVLAHYYLGFLYYHGHGVAQSYEKATEHFDQVFSQDEAEIERVESWKAQADRGEALAQSRMGFLYKNGVSILAKDAHQAVAYFAKAAGQGNQNAQMSLGLCYEKGEGVAQDLGVARHWYGKAAEQGHKNVRRSQVFSEAPLCVFFPSSDAEKTAMQTGHAAVEPFSLALG